MGFMEAVRHVFQNYATFSGRARRSEYWYFALFNMLVNMVGWALIVGLTVRGIFSYGRGGFLGAALGGSTILSSLLGIYNLACIIPTLAVTCRRLHDIGMPGPYMLFYLLPIVGGILLLVWLLQDSKPGDNEYGPNPKRYHGGMALNAGGVQVWGVTGVMKGRHIAVSGCMRIGRGDDCHIRFPPNTFGVSRHHCELTYSSGKLYIRDLGSTYGTYINGFTRLSPNQVTSLHSGDRINIGSDHEILAVM